MTPLLRGMSSVFSELDPDVDPDAPTLPDRHDWQAWLRAAFPDHFTAAFGEHHADFWNWVVNLERGERPSPFISIWSRGHGKSSHLEASCVYVGAYHLRTYVLYVCGTQHQADDHVANIADMLTQREVAEALPDLANPKIGRYGRPEGWRRNRLRTASGLIIDALGLDSAGRGAKVDEFRPDYICLDDLDGENDSEIVVSRKQRALTRKVIPAGSVDAATVGVQNIVNPLGIFAQLSDDRAKFLNDRTVSGPVPAVRNLHIDETGGRAKISGESTWPDGMSMDRLQAIVDDVGIESFLVEYQHVEDVLGAHPWRREFFASPDTRYDPDDLWRMRNLSLGRFARFDTANKDEPHNAYTAVVVGDIMRDGRIAITHAARTRVQFTELPEWAIEQLTLQHQHDRKMKHIWIEDAASGTQLLQVLGKTGPGWIRDMLAASPATKSKLEVWQGAALHGRREMILLPHPHEYLMPWRGDLENEIYAAPDTPFLDYTDAFSGLINDIERTYGYFSQAWMARRNRLAKQEQAAEYGMMMR